MFFFCVLGFSFLNEGLDELFFRVFDFVFLVRIILGLRKADRVSWLVRG